MILTLLFPKCRQTSSFPFHGIGNKRIEHPLSVSPILSKVKSMKNKRIAMKHKRRFFLFARVISH
ncbi:hypothetical protein CXT91_08305 [Akkermansia muciniphila]|uniref:Uncharacterized protein n=1 Tax=Akkermansia muciniphila TaxID=239935 RepID=A0AAX0WL07_9BACT|nr:hypothetical protein CXT91_08305 [Akkermansia muciniphila]PND04196.1 hypothetical protein CXT95_05395 [Akkermansia muciniphila]